VTAHRPAAAAEARQAFRAGRRRPTAGIAPGYVQANLVAVPERHAADFESFCRQNPQPCPVLEVTGAGAWNTVLAPGADLRTDLPGYVVWRDGAAVAEPSAVLDHWRDDLVTFLLGCSFTFDAVLQAAGLPVRHIEQARNVPMYRTDRACRTVGAFRAPLVVSMRPMPPELVDPATAISGRYPACHGRPVHVGDPAGIGIHDLDHPDFGDPVDRRPNEVPLFWACGVTSQLAVRGALLDLAITHLPGHMLVTDQRVDLPAPQLAPAR
jgi:uncharacterized protein YcsI (UPF0317 family)